MRSRCIPLIFCLFLCVSPAFAAAVIPFTVTMSEAVNVTGSPRIILNVDGNTRYAVYSAGTGTASLTFTYSATAGDVDLNGIGISSTSVDLNGGTVSDLNGNALSNLTFTAPANMGSVNVNYPSLSMDFIADADGRYSVNGTVYNDFTSFLTAVGGTFLRTTTATYFDSAGNLQTAASGVPRFDYDPVTHTLKGLLIEESRVNRIRNSTMQGAVAGTPGTLPTNWSIVYNPAGFSTQVVGTGTENGMAYMDFRVYGNTVASEFQLRTDQYTGAGAGQNWTGSMYLKLAGGSTTGISQVRSRITWQQTDGTYITQSVNNVISNLGATDYYRGIVTATAPASTGRISQELNIVASATGADITIRIAAPQTELGEFATSFIPTTTVAVTRAVDTFSMPTGAWFNATEGALYAATNPLGVASFYPQIALFGDGTSANFIAYTLFPSNNFLEEWKQSSSTLFTVNAGVVTAGMTNKVIGVYKSTSSAAVKNGGAPVTSAAALGTLPITLFSVGSNLARGGTDGRYSGTISNLRYYPLRSSNAQLQLLTQ